MAWHHMKIKYDGADEGKLSSRKSGGGQLWGQCSSSKKKALISDRGCEANVNGNTVSAWWQASGSSVFMLLPSVTLVSLCISRRSPERQPSRCNFGMAFRAVASG
jgi:hypothetical protein